MKNFHPFLLSFLSGLLLFAAWPASPLTFLIFIAFVPLLWLEHQGISRRKFFGWVYITMLTWNATTTWWIWNATAPGAIGTILANSLIMCLPWLGFHFVKAKLGPKWGYPALVALWLTFEYIHLQDWGLSWPWLTLGNVFAGHPGWVQWYSYTGTSGGGLWILIANILIIQLLTKLPARPFPKKPIILVIVTLILPFILSLLSYPADLRTLLPAPPKNNIVIVQPNIDPYEKLSTGSFEAMIHKLIRLSDSAIDNNTTLVIWPETALYMENGISEDNMKANYFLNPLWDFLRRHPQINLLSGVESYRAYQDGGQSSTARPIPNSNIYVDSYNAAIIFDSTGPLHFYHKSKLVPGVETLPFFLHFLDPLFEKFGGTTAGYTGQSDRTPLHTSNNSYTIAPAVCYESIYGEFMTNYVRNGADIIAIITNDGWWGNTPGYTQHEYYARLRAIETRRWVVRSANTGVSCIIDPTGRPFEERPWFQSAVIKTHIPAEQEQTFYVKYGDLLSRLAILAAILLAVWTPVQIIKNRKPRG
ncbi:MAG: apolipoprotein N-acyltransferase [Chitinophagaceae bacterium]|nr:apolipoprotein N-acyltransferase [Chitinophagaceae bacterium]